MRGPAGGRRPRSRARSRPRSRLPAIAALAAALPVLGLAACGGAGDAGDAASTDATNAAANPAATPSPDSPDAMSDASQDEWVDLVDDDLSAWRGYEREDLPAAWHVNDGVVGFTPGQEGGDIITRDEWGDFELELEFRVPEGGNSGVFYRAVEGYGTIWHGAPELQLLDDAGHADGADPATSAGSLYALYPPTSDALKPAGEWNHIRVVAEGPHVEHWLNGTKIVEYEAGSEDWRRRVEASKFAEYDGFGEARRGHIGLQDHGDDVWFRNIRIREISEGGS